MLIRRAMEGDVETLVQFNIALAKESENEILSVDVVTAGVRFALTHPAYAFYLVAELEGRVAGSLMITFEWSDWHNGLFLLDPKCICPAGTPRTRHLSRDARAGGCSCAKRSIGLRMPVICRTGQYWGPKCL